MWLAEGFTRNGANRHGAAPDSWFSHLAVEVPGDETSNEWLEAVDNTVYFKATGKEV